MPVHPSEPDGVARRRLLAGAGAGAAALVGLAAASGPAAADSDTAAGSTEDADINATPVTSTLASAAISGYAYRTASFFDFSPEGTSTRAWGGYGCYTTTSDYLWASVDLPAGARVRDIEWYVYNATGSTYTGLGRVWTAGDGSLFSPLVDVPMTSGSGIRAFRASISSANYGPFPQGCKVLLGISSPSSGSLQVNGARVGFTHGAGTTGLLPTPVRAYDSRVSGGKFSAGSTRTVTLPSSVAPVGTTGLFANVIAASPEADGRLKIWPGSSSGTNCSAISYVEGNTTTNAQLIGLSSSRQIKIWASSATHVVIDVSGAVG
jgi:hypothetical protein